MVFVVLYSSYGFMVFCISYRGPVGSAPLGLGYVRVGGLCQAPNRDGEG